MTQKNTFGECCTRVDLFRIRSLALHWRIKKPQDIWIWQSQGMRRGRSKTIMQILKRGEQWRDSK